MQRIVTLLFDSFKGSIGAPELGNFVAHTLGPRLPDLHFVNFPASDGGDGFADSLGCHLKAVRVACTVSDPLGRPVSAEYLWDARGRTAIIESAQANGLVLLRHEERDPLRATTLGVGQLLLDAVRRGARRILIGVGGSATIDAGVGMAQALGFTFLDAAGRPLGTSVAAFRDLADLIPPHEHPLTAATIHVACDVRTRLLGPRSAIRIYGPQKGGTPESLAQIESILTRLDHVVRMKLGVEFGSMDMGGAAGGLAAGLVAFARAELRPGMELFDQLTGMDAQVARSALVITGEGRLDEQSAEGKVVSYVAQSARRHRVPVIALCGSVAPHAVALDRVFALTDTGFSVDDCIARPKAALARLMPELAKAALAAAS